VAASKTQGATAGAMSDIIVADQGSADAIEMAPSLRMGLTGHRARDYGEQLIRLNGLGERRDGAELLPHLQEQPGK
jgi:hypothetical protein